MKMKDKLKLSVSLAFLVLLVLFWLGMERVASFQRQQLMESRFEQLTSLRESLASHIKDYEKSTDMAVKTIGHDRTVAQALVAFSRAFNALSGSKTEPNVAQLESYYNSNHIQHINTQLPGVRGTLPSSDYLPQSKAGLLLQQQYLLGQSAIEEQDYVQVHQQFNAYLEPLITLHGFYDLFLIDTAGNVVFSLTKEVDLGTNLLSGPYRRSGLAKAFAESRSMAELSFAHVPFSPYEPSFNMPASFVATPVYLGKQYVGSVAVQLPIEPINQIMTFNGKVSEAGLGDSGEVYLVGSDFTMRNDSRFIDTMQDPLIKALGTTIAVQRVQTEAVEKAQLGQSGVEVIDDYRNQSVLSAYAPIDLFGEKAVILAEIDYATVVNEINSTVNALIVRIIIGAILLWALVVVFFNQLFLTPLRKINNQLGRELQEQERQVVVSIALLNEYKKAVDASSIVSKTDQQGNITYVNDAFCETTGYTQHELIGKSHNIVRSQKTPARVFDDLWKTITQNKIWKGIICNATKNGEDYYLSSTVVPILTIYGEVQEYIAIGTDVTELYLRQEEILQHTTDELTQLPNRQKFLKQLAEAPVPRLAIVNIDHFSEVNDFYGYDVGDALLINIAKFLLDIANGEIGVYRLSGDEFGLLGNPGCPADLFENRCLDIIETLSDTPFKIMDNELSVSATMGVAEENGNVYVNAGMALRVAKESQKKFLFYNSSLDIQKRTGENLRWTKAIKYAIENDRIALFIQPILNVESQKISKYECLMRLIGEDGKEVSPFFFIDIAKHARLYTKLSEIIIRKSFEYFSSRVESFSINLTIIDIMNPETIELLKTLIAHYDNARQVVLEIVESEGIDNFEEVSEFIQDMKSLGCRIAIDDFGTGYSNFEYLMKLDPDFIKIDGSIVKNIVHDDGVYAIIKLINDFAQSIGAKTIAEHVSDPDIAARLNEIGVDYMQGYHFGRPSSTQGSVVVPIQKASYR